MKITGVSGRVLRASRTQVGPSTPGGEYLRRHWHPDAVYRRRDPTGQIYGVKDRHTVFRVTLDKTGNLKRLVMLKHSGLEFMDNEARAAFKRAAPFVNPPKGLVNSDGLIERCLNFDFFWFSA